MKKRNLIFFLCCMLYLMSYFQRSSPTVISLDLMRDMGFTLSDLSMVSGSTMLAYGLMQMPAGLLTDRLGPRHTLIALTLLSLGATVFFSSAQTFETALFSRFLLGMGVSVLVPCMALICQFYSPSESGRVIGVIIAAGSLGPLVSAAPLAILSNAIGWRFALLFFGGVTLFVLLAFVLFVPRETPQTKELSPHASLRDVLHGIGEVLGSRHFWPLCLWQMFTSGGIFMLNTLWWGPYLMQGHGLDNVTAGTVLLASSLAMIISQPGFGWLSDMVFKSRKKPMFIATALSVGISLTFGLWNSPKSVPCLITQAVLLTIGFVGTAPLLFALVRESFPSRLSGTALGCVNMLFPIWAFLLQKLFGIILDAGLSSGASVMQSYAHAGWLVTFNAAAAMLMILLIRDKTLPSVKQDREP